MKRRTWDEDRARQLYEEGKSDIDIADLVGASAGAITAWRYRNHLRSKNPPVHRAPVPQNPAPPAMEEPSPKEETPAVMELPNTPQPHGPVDLSISIAGCTCSLAAPDQASAVWIAQQLCGIVEKFLKEENQHEFIPTF